MISSPQNYVDISDNRHSRRENTPWYWRLTALVASWMILGGFLILPGLYAREPQLKFSQAVLSVIVVALLTAGYSFTALVCFACRNDMFQAERVFLPALASSVFGVISIAYNFLASRSYEWGTAAVSGTVVSTAGTLLYSVLLIWKHHQIKKKEAAQRSRSNLWSEQSYYQNYIPNMYPTATRAPSQDRAPIMEDDRVSQNMALLLRTSESRPSPDTSATFQINMPGDSDEHDQEHELPARSQERIGTPQRAHSDWNRDRANSRPDSLSEQQAWQQWQDRGRTPNRPSSTGARSSHSRGISREERRREIELGRI